jgi:23S rRNA (cytosine1962-C5)-methyltransferase
LHTVRVNRKAAGRVASGHPWIFKSDVIDTAEATPGDVVRVIDSGGRGLGVAHYSAASQITLRMLGQKFDIVQRLHAAQVYRDLVVENTEAYRLVHAEADYLPALIIDRYQNYFIIQALDQGMDRALPEITQALIELFPPLGVIARNDAAVRTQEDLPRETKIVYGEIPETVPIRMNGVNFHVDLQHGQKTGMFLDQRENYTAAEHWARGNALDCFTSTGGFALHIARACEHVEAIDSSATAIAAAIRNQESNSIPNIHFQAADVFEYLAGRTAARHHYDTIVLDPPAFAKSRQQLDGAIRGYKEINLRALKLLRPGGILVTCSCSHHLSEADFLEVIAQASLDAGRALRVLERRTQAPDHPILLTVPETHYLKCVILQTVD